MKLAIRLLAAWMVLTMISVGSVRNTAAQPPTQTAPDSDWPYYGNDLGNMRYVNVDQINPGNVANLKPAWIFHTGVGTERTSFESQPIVVDGTLYISSPHDHVYALDAATGALKWSYNPDMPALYDMAICCGQTNRGVAVGGGKVYIGQLDGTLAALDAATGQVAWKIAVDDWRHRWTETMAPQYVDGKVLIGGSGGEYLVRGHLSAYDANNGNLLWRFHTIPGPGEFGNDTWAGDSWQGGAGTVWTTPAVDPALGLVYMSTGNAGPDLDGSQRAGTNLFTASVVAVDLNTGKYRWHFQEVHHDIWDFDGPQPPHLFTLEKDGQQVPAVGHANKSGYYFILDRRDGTPLYPVREARAPMEPAWQKPWPTQPESTIEELIPHSVLKDYPPYKNALMWTPPGEEPKVFQPGAESGPEWAGAAYSPRTKYSYIPAGGYEAWLIQAVPDSPNTLGSTLSDRPSHAVEDRYGLFDAVDTTTGKIAWKMQVPERVVSGITVAGDLVFMGESNGKFNALDARSGQVLWTYTPDRDGVGGANGSSAVYVEGGREYVVMAFGGNTQVRSGQISPVGDALIAFALPQDGVTEPNVVKAQPKQLEAGGIPQAGLIQVAMSAPPDALVVEVTALNTHFYPNYFTAPPGRKVAIHAKNLEPNQVRHNIAIAAPGGWIGVGGALEAGQEGYVVFTTPMQPGNYTFWCDIGTHRVQGMIGQVGIGVNNPPQGDTLEMPRSGTTEGGGVIVPFELSLAPGTPPGDSPGMPRTGIATATSLTPDIWLWLAAAGTVLLVAGVYYLRRSKRSVSR
ncbi:MAG: PQQ-binding-like beta-propeller repeat protein [Chloroflexia bacterium]